MRLSLIIPTYNEKENIKALVDRIEIEFKTNKIKGELIIVDDNSPDGTGNIVEGLKQKHSFLKVIHRKGKLGLSSAVLEGFSMAKGEVLGVMDSDLSHPPEKLHQMLNLIEKKKADLVIGSRHEKGGRIEGWGIKMKLLSKGATLLARVYTDVKDPMSGFFLIKKSCIRGKSFNPQGFKILLEVLLKADYRKIAEVPIVFVNRKKGKSKAGAKEIFYYLSNLLHYLPYMRAGLKEFIKFCLVGLTGTLINLAVLYWFTEFLGVYYLVSAIFAFVIAATSNYVLNKIWTFKEKMQHQILPKYAKFFAVSVAALGVNLLFLYIFTEFLSIHYLVSQALAIIISMIINFLGNKWWTFKK